MSTFTNKTLLIFLCTLFALQSTVLSAFEDDFTGFNCSNNVIGDGDLETSNIKDYWQFVGNTWRTTTSSNVNTGSKAIGMNNNNGTAGIYQKKSASPGQTYSLSVFAKSSSGNGDVGFRFLNSSDGIINDYKLDVDNSNTYKEYTLSGTAPAGTAYVQVFGIIYSSGTFYVDSYCMQNWTVTSPPSCSNSCPNENAFDDSVLYLDPTGTGNGWLGYINSNLEVCNNGDGTYSIRGSVIGGNDAQGWGGTGNPCGSQDGYYINLQLTDRQTWAQFQGNYEEDPSAPNHTDWDYYKVTGTFTGLGCNAGTTVDVFDASMGYRMQVGQGANSNRPSEFGFATWFDAKINGSYVGSDLYGVFSSACYEVCSNITNGGTIGVDQSACGTSYDPETIQNVSLPSGGSGTLDYVWLKSTTTCSAPSGINDSNWSIISGANNASYNPGVITATTCYVRFAKRSGCSDYTSKSNVVTVDLFTDGVSVNIPEDNTSLCTEDEIVLHANTTNASTCGTQGESDCNHSLESYGGWVENPDDAAYCGQAYGAKLWTKAGDGTSFVEIDFGNEKPSGTTICVNMKLEHCSNTSSDYSDAKIRAWNSSTNSYTTLVSSKTFTSNSYKEYCYTLGHSSRYVKVSDNGKCAFRVDYVRTETQGTQSSAVTYAWSGPGIIGSANEANVTVNTAGTYAVTVTDCTGCKAVDDIVITNNNFSANAGNDASICVGQSTTLEATAVAGATYEWKQQGGNNVLSTSRTYSVSPTQNTIYILTVTKNGCEDSDDVLVSVSESPAITSIISSNEDCNMAGTITFFFNDNATQTNIEFSINGGVTYNYNSPDNAGFFKIENVAVGTYSLYARWGNGECAIQLGTKIIKNVCNPTDYFVNLQDEEYSICEIIQLNEDVSANDSYSSLNGVEEYSLKTTPNAGTLNFNPNGTFTYDNNSVGTNSFTYELCIEKLAETPPTEVCQGGIKSMSVIYKGTSGVTIVVSNKNASSTFATFNNVQNEDVLEITNNTGVYNSQFNNWLFKVNGSENTLIHTSCSVPILGRTFGDFYVLGYANPNGTVNSMIIQECDQATATIIIGSSEATIEAVDALCSDSEPVQLVATPSGGTFSGNGVSSTGLFTPSTSNIGLNVIQYDYSDANGCASNVQVTVEVKDCMPPFDIDIFNDCGSDKSLESTIKGLMGGVSQCMAIANSSTVNRVIAGVWIERGDCNNNTFPSFITLSFDGQEVNVSGIDVIQSSGSSEPERLYRVVYPGNVAEVCLVDGGNCDVTSMALYIERNDPNASSSLIASNQELHANGGPDDCFTGNLQIGNSDLPRDIKIQVPIHEKDNSRAVSISVVVKDDLGNILATDNQTFTMQNAGIEAAIYTMMLEDVAGHGIMAEVTVCSPSNNGDSFGVGAITASASEGCVECDLAGSVNDEEICKGQTASLTASFNSSNGGLDYLWSTGETTESISVSPSITQQYLVTVTDSEGCTKVGSATVTVNFNPTVTLNLAGPFCSSDASYQLQANPSGGTFSGTGVSSSGLFTPSSAQIGNNVISYTYTSPAGCGGSAEITIVVNESADAGSIAGNEQNCGSYDGAVITSTSNPSGSDCGSIVYTGVDVCDDGGKPISMTLLYNGEGCQSSNGQGTVGGKWDCNGDPQDDPNVYITTNANGITYNVSLNQTFTVSGSVLPNPVVVRIYNEQGGTQLQYLEIHTSCSAPVIIGDQFGSLVLAATVFDNGNEYGSDESLQVKWQQKIGSGEWTDIAGANSNTYDPGLIYTTTEFRRVASNCCGSDVSNVVIKTVFPPIFANAGSDQNICSGFSADLKATVGLSGEPNGFILRAQPESTGANNNIKFKKDGTQGPRLLVYANGNATPITLYATKKARIESVNKDHNHDDPKVGYDGSEFDRTLVDFNISSISGTIDQAKLVLLSETAKTLAVGVYAAPASWNADKVTWNRSDVGTTWNTPGGIEAGSPLLDVKTITAQGDVMWDVTALVDAWVNGNTTGGGNYTYNWSHGLGSGSMKTVSPSSTTTYTVTVTDGNGCSDTDQVTVEVSNEELVPGEIGVDQDNCGAFDPDEITSLIDPSGVCDISSTEDCCDSGDKPVKFTLFYNGGNCAEGQNSQGQLGGKWDCTGNANNDPQVYIVAVDTDFSGIVNLNGSFNVTDGGNNLPNPVVLKVYASQGGSLLQTIEIHTSCSAPIVAGDQFGSLVLLGTVFQNTFECEAVNGALLVQWQSQLEGGNWTNLDGETSLSYDPPFTTETTKFRREVTNCCGSAYSNEVTISVNDAVEASLDPAGPFCITDNAYQLTFAPNNGTFSGNGVSASGLFTPADAGAGTTTVTYTVSNGNCSEEASIDIIVNELPSVTATASSDPVCYGESVTLTATGSGGSGDYSYEWSDGLGSGSEVIVNNITANATYNVTVTDVAGCSAESSVEVKVSSVIATASDDVEICDGATTTISVTATGGDENYTYAWDNGAGSTASVDVSPAVTTTYTVTVTDGNGCKGIDEVVVTVNDNPTVVLDAAGPLCADADAVQLNATPTGGTFSGTGVNASGMFDPSVSGTGSFTITYSYETGAGCSGEATTEIVVNEQPSVTAIADPNPVCEDEMFTLTATASGGGGDYTYTWSDGLGSGSSVTVNGLQSSKTYSVTATDINGCSDVAAVEVIVEEKAVVGDFVFTDKNNDGIQDAGDIGLDGVSVTLYKADGTEVASTTSMNGGAYSFIVCSGEYYIIFGDVENTVRSPKDQTTDDKDSDADPANGKTDNFTLNPGDNNEDVDAGYSAKASLGDLVFLDKNGDGIQDAGENGVPEVTVNLKDAGGNVIATTTTNENGLYEFAGLTPGEYSVQFVLPDGTNFSPLNQGGDEAKDSDADPAMNGMTEVVTLESGENNEDLDAGVFETASLGDFVFLDTNADGIQDPGENGVEGIPVNLKDANGNVIATTATLADGSYEFTGLTPGDYSVQFVLPGGSNFSPLNQGGDEAKDSDADPVMNGMTEVVTLESGENNVDLDAGIYKDASIGDFVFLDKDGDGIQDAGENGVEGVTVNLKDSNGEVIASTMTLADGSYEFTGLTPGDYSVQFVLPNGSNFSPLNVGGDEAKDSDADPAMNGMTEVVTLESGENNEDLDAGIYEDASLGDFVFLDKNGDGIQDPGEDGVEGVTVNLKDSNGEVINSTLTLADGSYEFTGLTPGDYSVQFVLPGGSNFSPLNQGGDEAKDSDADPAMNGMTEVVTLESGENNEDLDAGIYEDASLGDFVFLDKNGDGIQDPGENGVEGVSVNLKDSNGNVIATTATLADGSYVFTGLTPGDYSVQFVLPGGSNFSPLNQGGDEAKDSDADPAMNGMTEVVTLESGDNNEDLDAGIYKGASLGDFVFLDNNGDGIQDAGDIPFANIDVNLKDSNGDVIASTTTNGSGKYEFTGLAPGDYSVQFVLPSDAIFSPLNQGGDEAKDSDADPDMNGMTEAVTLESGDNYIDLDAGLYFAASIGDFVFLDEDGDGIQDPGEGGVEGVTVNLKDSNGDVIASTMTLADGSYEFTGLTPGDYSVQFVLPGGSNFSPLNVGGDEAKDSDADPAMSGMTEVVTLKSGENNKDLDAGIYEDASLGDFVFLDKNGDGIQDPGENGVPEVTVNLKDAGGNVIATTTTNENGLYEFTGLTPGDYSVQFVLPGGSNFSPLNQGGDEAKDSDADPAMSGMTAVVTLESGENNKDLDAGIFKGASLGDFVFLDEDGDGIQDPGENGVEGVTVNLKDKDGNVIASTMTLADGSYEFTGLAPGDYSVQFVLPGGNAFSPLNAGGDEAKDSDADPAMNGMTEVVTLESGENNEDLDAGIFEPASVGDYVFNDKNNDGIQNAGDEPFEGVIIKLTDSAGNDVLDADGNPVLPTESNPDGSYLFDNLVPGDYIVVFVSPDNFDPTKQDAGGAVGDEGDANDDSDINSEGKSYVVTLSSGENEGDVDAGFSTIADLNLVKRVDNASPIVGSVVTFNIIVENEGPNNATGVSIGDALPNGYGSISNISNNGVLSGKDILWSDLSIPALGNIEVTFKAEVLAPGIGISYVNIAKIESSDQFDPDSTPGNEADSSPGGGIGSQDPDDTQDPNDEDDGDDAVVTPLSPSISIEKHTNGMDSDFPPGQTIAFLNGTEAEVVWTYYVTNNGDMDLVDVEVTDNVEGFICTIPSLLKGETKTCTKLGVAIGGLYSNIGTAVGTPLDPDTGEPLENDKVTDKDPSNYRGVRYNIESTVTPGNVCPGETVDIKVAIRLYPDSTMAGEPIAPDPLLQLRNISFTSEALGITLTTAPTDPYFDNSNDLNGDGNLGQDEFEFFWNYNVVVTETSTFEVMDMFDIYYDEEFLISAMAMDEWMVTADPANCASLGNYVWSDKDADGIQDANEDGVNGITVNLLDSNGDPIATSVTMNNPLTGNDGFYEFTGLLAGDYIVEFVDPSGTYKFSPSDVGQIGNIDPVDDSDANPVTGRTAPIMLAKGEDNPNIDAGIFLPASIGNFVWNDANGNGLQDDGETGILDAVVLLTTSLGVPVFDLDGVLVGPEITEANGIYSFDNLPPGQYQVTFIKPTNLLLTLANVGGFDTDATDINGDSDADPITGKSHIIDLEAGEQNNDIDAGYYNPSSIGDYVWNDEDGDGVQDGDEVGVNGITVNLYTDEDMDGMIEPGQLPINTIVTMTNPNTNIDGYYIFNGLPSGKYLVEFETDGYIVSPQDQGGNDTKDSDINPTTGLSPSITLGEGENNTTIDAGVYIGGGLGDLVWVENSSDNPDSYDVGVDIPKADVVVNLQKQNDLGDFVQIATTETNANGGYFFDNLSKGIYKVEFINPGEGLVFVTQNVGKDSIDSDPNSAGLTEQILLGAGEVNIDVDAGFTLAPVPVELVSFTGKWNQDRDVNELMWETSSEINNDYFEVERSQGNTGNFSVIAKVAGNGTTFESQYYDLADRNIDENGIYFYRLKQYDYDGTFAYSDIIAIRVEREVNTEISVYPNPTIDFINVEITSAKQEDITIQLFDMAGKLIMTKKVQAGDVQYNNKVRIKVGNLPSGIYNVITTVGTKIFNDKINVLD